MAKVSLTKTGDRRKNVFESLKLIEDEIKESIDKKQTKQIVIKPNFVSNFIQLAATHVDHIRGILDFFKKFYKKKIIIAESSAHGNAMEGFKNFGYFDLENAYNIKLFDLDEDDYEIVEIVDWKNKPIAVKVAKTILDPKNYIISAAKLKTHDTVVVTLSLKNIVMGSVLSSDKSKMHQGYINSNKNIFRVAKKAKPDLASIDGFVGMEGNGPTQGTPIDVGVAIASTDFLAADRVACEIMGVDFSKVGYLTYCAQSKMGESNLEKIKIVGEKLENCKKKFKLHLTVKEQYKWK